MGKLHESNNGVVLSFKKRSSQAWLLSCLWTSPMCRQSWCLFSLSAEPTDKPTEFRPLQNVVYHPNQNVKEKGMPLEGWSTHHPCTATGTVSGEAINLICKHYASNGHQLKISELLGNYLFVIFVDSGASWRSWSSKLFYAHAPTNSLCCDVITSTMSCHRGGGKRNNHYTMKSE